MAWHTLRSSAGPEGQAPEAPGFLTGLLVQLTNVKIMVFCLMAMTSFVLPYTRSFWALLAVGLFLPFTGPAANLAWLFAGAALQKLFANHRKAVDIVCAAAPGPVRRQPGSASLKIRRENSAAFKKTAPSGPFGS